MSQEELQAELAAVSSKLIAAGEALKAVEWGGYMGCPGCDQPKNRGHMSDCVVGVAIAALEAGTCPTE